MLFPLNPVTLLLSWIGHVVYGAVLGAFLGRYSARRNATRSSCSWVVKPAAKMAS
jgi:RsiW-degrading membrane proteinase PrsW (M82 family)